MVLKHFPARSNARRLFGQRNIADILLTTRGAMGTQDEVQVTLLGFTVPDDVIGDVLSSDRAMPIQTHNFAWSLVRALVAGGCRVTLLSAAPASTFPRNRRVLFRGRRFVANGVHGELLGFINLQGVKHVTRFLSLWHLGLKALSGWRSRVMLVHGVHSPFLWFGAAARRIRGVRLVAVLTDPPGGGSSDESSLTRFLRRIDRRLVRSALAHCDGVVALTAALANDFAPGRPYLIMDGIISAPARLAAGNTSQPRETFDIAYAGGLKRAYGIDRLVEAVRGIPDSRVRLLTFGRGELETWIRRQSELDGRIRPAEFLVRDELLIRLARADLLVNPRPIDQDFVSYSFPSKLLEYLASGTPVVTTRLPGISSEYEGRVVFADDDTAGGLQAAIHRVMSMRPEEARDLGDAAAAFVKTTRSDSAQGAKIRSFLLPLLVAPDMGVR